MAMESIVYKDITTNKEGYVDILEDDDICEICMDQLSNKDIKCSTCKKSICNTCLNRMKGIVYDIRKSENILLEWKCAFCRVNHSNELFDLSKDVIQSFMKNYLLELLFYKLNYKVLEEGYEHFKNKCFDYEKNICDDNDIKRLISEKNATISNLVDSNDLANSKTNNLRKELELANFKIKNMNTDYHKLNLKYQNLKSMFIIHTSKMMEYDNLINNDNRKSILKTKLGSIKKKYDNMTLPLTYPTEKEPLQFNNIDIEQKNDEKKIYK
jgi:hypothetical protein